MKNIIENKLIKNSRLSTKLWFLTMGLVISVMMTSGLISYFRTYEALEEKGKTTLSNAVVMAIEMMELQQKDYLEGNITLESAQEDILSLLSMESSIDLGENGYFVVLNSKGKILAHPTLVGVEGYDLTDESKDKRFFVQESIEKAKKGGGFTYFEYFLPGSKETDEKIMYALYYEPWDWIVEATAYMSDYNKSAMIIFSEMIKVFVIIVVFVFVFIRFFIDDLLEPITKTIDAMSKVEKGVFPQVIEENRNDELAILISGYNHMALSVRESQEALLRHNEELEDANKEIQALYEEMLASEEMLRFNYDELEHYREALEREKENYRKILIASNEVYWQYNFSIKEMTVTNFTKDMSTVKYAVKDFLEMVFPDDVCLISHYFDGEENVSSSVFEMKIRLLIDVNENLYHWFQILGIKEDQSLFGSMTDIHHDVINKERIEFYAFHDPVLGLYNMDFLNDIVSNSIASEESQYQYVLLEIGIVGYSRILTAYGKNLTDIMSFQLSAEISHAFSDAQYISMLHSGRFALWMRCDDPKVCASQQLHLLEQTLKSNVGRFANIEMPVNIAYGATLINGNHKESAHILSEAETAFEYAASKGIFHEIQWYDASLKVNKDRILSIEQHLYKAIERGEMYLVYQPQYSSKDKNEVFGYEALLRWENDDLGFVPPNEFIPLAEALDNINELGRFVIAETVAFICRQKMIGNHIHVSINASYKELLQNDYVDFLVNMLRQNEIDIDQVHIEITETTISEYIDVVLGSLKELVRQGFQVHMDDFGTGYSSLYQLGRMPIQFVKIDKSFVWALESDDKMYALTKLIIDVAHRMDMKIIAEGVETNAQYDVLAEMGCDYYQGYLLSKPLLEADIN